MRWIQPVFILVIVVVALTAGKAANLRALGPDRHACTEQGTVERADVHASPDAAARPAAPVFLLEGPRPVACGVMPAAPARLHAVGDGIMWSVVGIQPPLARAAGMVMRV